MANSFTKSEIIYFEEVLEGFDPNNVTSKNTKKYSPAMSDMERSGLTVRRPTPMIAEVTTGRDVSSDYKDVQELTVPSTLAESDIKNVAFTLNALELNDPTRRSRAAKAGAQALAAKIDTDTSDQVKNYGSLVVTSTGEFTSYDDLASGETALYEREMPDAVMRSLILNPRMAKKMANELGSRATDNGRDRSAYERSLLPPVGGFETLRANVLSSLTGSSSSGVTVNGANQRKTPTVFDGTNTAAADNRSMSLTVSASSGLAVGDAFTIAGVNSVGMISKKDTGQLQTFRIIADEGSNVFTISPAIIPIDQSGAAFKRYGNCTTTPANGAAITLLNTATKSPSIFFVEDAVEIIHGKLGVDDLGPTVSIMRETTDSGIEVIMAKQGNIDDLTAKYRLTCWTKANVLEPQMAGIYLPGQGANFGI